VIVIAACAALVVVGVVLVVRWGVPPSAPAAEPGLRGWLRYGGASLAAGLVAGVLAAGAGGRIVMRLLAIASPDARGSLTEAGEFVGEITVDGTLGFILFAGLPAGVLAGVLYALLRPLVGPGRLGGLALGALLLVLAATRIDPLRSENIDFALLDAGWLAVPAFVVLGLFHGLVVAAVGALIARPPAIGPRAILAGRVAVGVVALVALPGFVASVGEIVTD
jgi:hypothetical protein